MNEKIELVKPTIELEKEYLDIHKEWKASGEVMIPWVISKDPADFQGMVQFLRNNEKGDSLPDAG